MKWHRRALRLALLFSLTLAFWAGAFPVAADENDVRVIEADFVYAVDFPESAASDVLLVQATSWVSNTYYYVITISNLTPWPMGNVLIVDRYFPPDPTVEFSQVWEIEGLEPGQVESISLAYDQGPLEEGCHQLELTWGEGWSAVLMDCGVAGTSTLWQIAANEDMAVYPDESPLTEEEPSGRSKLGLHVTRNADPAIMAFIEEEQPAVVAAVGDLGWLSEVKEVSPDTITIGRFQEDDQQLDGDPIEQARAFVDGRAGQYLANDGVDYWLGWNEPDIDGPEQMAWYAEFERERVIAMGEIGLRTAVGNFSTGRPEPEEFAEFLPAIEAVQEYDGVLALHEYSAPNMREGYGDVIPGMDAEVAEAGSLTLRYRNWYETYLRHNDLVVPLIITEAGVDGGVLKEYPGEYGGWQTFTGELTDDLDNITLEQYLDDLDWYDNELRRDPYVLGFAVFNIGDNEGEWSTFDLTDELEDLGSIVSSKAD